MAASLTQDIGAFVAGLTFDAIPAAAVEVVETGTIDGVGVMIPGRAEANVGIVERRFRTRDEAPESRLFMTDERVSAPLAALVNGVAMHVLDYDDVALPLGGHPSTVLVPALLAEADAVPGTTGKDLVRAYVAGYEVWAEVAGRDADAHHLKGWHPTSALGVLGAAAACAVLRGLDADKAAQAIGIAASEACGLVANFGSMTKSFHAGRAAQAGVLAARLAEDGLTAAPDVLEHPRGFLAALSPAGKVDRESPAKLGRSWQIVAHRVGVKKYPMCYAVHRALDAILDLRAETGVKAEAVTGIRVELGAAQAAILRNSRPRTGLEAKFSIEFAMASALVAGRAGLSELTDPFVRGDEVQRLIRCVEVQTTEERISAESIFAPFDRVTLTLADGKTLESAQVVAARGDADLPLSRDELWAKFEDCLAQGAYGRGEARALFDALDDMPNLASMADLPSLGRSAVPLRATS